MKLMATLISIVLMINLTPIPTNLRAILLILGAIILLRNSRHDLRLLWRTLGLLVFTCAPLIMSWQLRVRLYAGFNPYAASPDDLDWFVPMLLRISVGVTWLSLLSYSLSWTQIQAIIRSPSFPAWLGNLIEEAACQSALFMRAIRNSYECARQRSPGKLGPSSAATILAAGVDRGYYRILINQGARAVRLAQATELSCATKGSVCEAANFSKATNTEPKILQVENLSLHGSIPSKPLLDQISFELHSGEWLGILGKSGAGKTTLLKVLAGIRKASSGTLRMHGELRPLSGSPFPEIGFIFQNPEHSVLGVTAWEDAIYGLTARKDGNAASHIEYVHSLFEEFKTEHLKDRLVNQLSFGELKRLNVVSALSKRPNILLCDEPTSGLDPQNAHILIHSLRTVAQRENISILWASHDLHLLPRDIRRALIIEKNQITKILNLEEIKISTLSFLACDLWPKEPSFKELYPHHAIDFNEPKISATFRSETIKII
jgi:ABC-type multidrug transport system ATPase subunit